MGKVNKRNNKTICLPFSKEYYQKCMDNSETCRQFLIATHAKHPELFPKDFKKGFKFNGFVNSKIRLRIAIK